MNLPIEELIKLLSGSGLFGVDSLEGALGTAVGGAVPGVMLQSGPEAAAAALLGGGAGGALMRQVPLGKVANAVGSAARSMPAAAAASLAGGAAGGVMDEQERMRRMLMGMYT